MICVIIFIIGVKTKSKAMQYQFIIKKSATKNAAIIFKGAWIECNGRDDAWDKFYIWVNEHPEYSITNSVVTIKEKEASKGRGGKRPGTGGKRTGAGRPKGSGKWGDEPTKIARIPSKAAAQIEELMESQSTLDGILQAWKAQCKLAEKESSTGKIPRTYDKAIQLIKELEEEVNKLPFIV